MSDDFISDWEDSAGLTAEETAIQNRTELEKSLNNVWGHSFKGMEAKKAAIALLNTKNGMYARIPLICKGEGCPYVDSCMLIKYDLAPIGEACAKETAEIEIRYAAYDSDFDLDKSSFTDRNLVSELINYDIMLDRLRALLAKEQVLVVDVVTGITEQGEEFTHPEVSKTWEAYERVEKKRNNIYDLMLATRKSNKSDKSDVGAGSLTNVLSHVMSVNDFVIDVKPENMN